MEHRRHGGLVIRPEGGGSIASDDAVFNDHASPDGQVHRIHVGVEQEGVSLAIKVPVEIPGFVIAGAEPRRQKLLLHEQRDPILLEGGRIDGDKLFEDIKQFHGASLA